MWGRADVATKPNQVLHFDFMHINNLADDKYVLVLKDGFSGFCELVPCDSEDHFVVAEAILDWISRFGIPEMFVSDRGSHFKNLIMQELSRLLSVKHHFTVAYSPWSNGTVERLNRELKKLLRVLLSDFKMKFSEWKDVLPMVQTVLNHSKSERLKDHCPIEVFTGLKPKSAVDLVFRKSTDVLFAASERVDVAEHVKDLRAYLEEMHKDIAIKKATIHDKNVKSQGRVVDVNFDVGDYVLLSRKIRSPAGKLVPTWIGPYQVIRVLSDWVFEVKSLLDPDDVVLAHSRRLRFYEDSSLNVTEDIKDYVQYSQDKFEIEEILDIRETDLGKELFIQWLGFERSQATWESFDEIMDSVPKMVKSFMTKRR
jgi:transposase InsO family protein